MSEYLRKKNLYDPKSKYPFRLSRSKLENFLSCPRCFYLDRRLGLEPPGIPAFTLNSAVDSLLKKEFDVYRRRQQPHPLMTSFGVDAIPLDHPNMDIWRENFKGIQVHHSTTNFLFFGALDDLWITPLKEMIVVDYKATSTEAVITLDTEYRQAYKRQMEIYQWLLRRQGYSVSNVGYFVYCNADKSVERFDHKLQFKIELMPYQGNDQWVESALIEAYQCLIADDIPMSHPECEYCLYCESSSQLVAGGLKEKDFSHTLTVVGKNILPIKKKSETSLYKKTKIPSGELQAELF